MKSFLKNQPLPKLWKGFLLAGLLGCSLNSVDGGFGNEEDRADFQVTGLSVPEDISISIFARGMEEARHMAFDDQGILFLTLTHPGKLIALPDANRDGKADQAIPILQGRDKPHGLAFVQLESGYYLYVAEQSQIVRLKRQAKPYLYGKPEVVRPDIPSGKGHWSRTIKIKDNKVYLSTGASCNICEEEDPMRAAITRFNLDGTGKEIFAAGLRNSVGIEFSPYTGELWGMDNDRDYLNDDYPAEELNFIRKGKHYGWPHCFDERKPDPEWSKGFDCSKTEPPAYTFTAHMAPLGLEFYQTGRLPSRYNNSLFIAFHGSDGPKIPVGYKVVRVRLDEDGKILSHEDFVTGWLKPNGNYTGRPVDLELSPEGDLYLSDDQLSLVYRITRK